MAGTFNRRCLLRGAGLLSLGRCFGVGQAAAPPSPYGPRSTAEEVTAGLDLKGMTALVTGCNSGIGYETMRVLALRGAHVLGTGRTPAKARRACDSVTGRATPLLLELADFDSVVACAEQARASARVLDMLICNAGVLLPRVERMRGLEMHFVVNHLGHFLLVNRLLDRVEAAPQGRIVVVSSVAHWSAPAQGIAFDDLGARRGYDALEAYGQSKLANGLFAMELARRLAGTNATANVLHPGVVDTNLFRHSTATIETRTGRKTVAQGAATSCYVATHPSLADVSGCYFEDCNAAEPSALMHDVALAEELWSVSQGLVEDYLA